MILDYKINKKLVPYADKLRDDVVKYLNQFSEIKLTNAKLDTISKVCKCITLNIADSVKKKRTKIFLTLDKNSYRNPAIYNGNNTGRKVSYTYMRIVLQYLQNNTDFELFVGGMSEWYYNKQERKMVAEVVESSYITIPDYVIEDFIPLVSTLEVENSVLEVRDVNGNIVAKRLPERQKELVKLLTKFNYKLIDSELVIDDNTFSIQVKKVYNNSTFKEGGRVFMSGENLNKFTNKENRMKLIINGLPTVECDYKCLWPSIIADEQGIYLSRDFDPYGVKLEGYCEKTLRSLSKIGLMCLLNADSFDHAMYALISEMKTGKMKVKIDEAKDEGNWIDFPIARMLLEKLMDHNAYMSDYFFSKSATKLMAIESAMMDYIIEQVVGNDDEIMIPLHDSVIVQEPYKHKAISIMEKAYNVVVGGNNCVVKCK